MPNFCRFCTIMQVKEIEFKALLCKKSLFLLKDPHKLWFVSYIEKFKNKDFECITSL